MATIEVPEFLVAEKLGLKTRPEKNLCHYTTQEGLIGILQKTKVLYATDATYLNDSQEMAYAVTLARKYFKNKPRTAGSHTAQNTLNVLDQTETLVQKLPVYVTSFSEEPDLLSQWRGYCPRGSGFALCIAPDRMSELAGADSWTLLKCIYDEAEQIEVIKKMEEYAESYSKTNANAVSTEVVFNVSILNFGIALKHPKFKEEAEWRAIKRIGGTASIRPGASTLTPYMHFPLTLHPTDPIKLAALYVGPTPHADLAKKAAGTLLRLTNTTCPDPISSEIPFRNW